MRAALLIFIVAGAAWAQAKKPIPRADDGKPDFSGVWVSDSRAAWSIVPQRGDYDTPASPGFVEGGALPYLPAALKQRDENAKNFRNDPLEQCHLAGVPRSMYIYPWKMVQTKNDITILYEYNHGWRIVHTDGRAHLDDLDSWLGDSVARFEGDVLVVDVTNFNGKSWFDMAGNYSSDKLHIVERYKYVDGDTLQYSAVIEDPKTFSKAWTLTIPVKRAPKGTMLEEFECTEAADRAVPKN